MYEQYWGLKERPFQNTPNPRFFYYSTQHEEVLNRLIYVVQEQMGAGMLTGVFGCGKTLIAQALISKLNLMGNYKIILITNPQLSHIELMRSIAHHLGVPNLPIKKSEIMLDYLIEVIEETLRANWSDGKNTVLILDEAHLIEDKIVLEELRLLLNFQLADRFLLTLLLLGQPELKRNIDSIKQFSQRIAIHCHLDRFSEAESNLYIKHRLKIAEQENNLFTDQALHSVWEASGGIPRRINHICNLALLAGFGKRLQIVDVDTIREVSKEIEGDTLA